LVAEGGTSIEYCSWQLFRIQFVIAQRLIASGPYFEILIHISAFAPNFSKGHMTIILQFASKFRKQSIPFKILLL
jgi:hypothetical protein